MRVFGSRWGRQDCNIWRKILLLPIFNAGWFIYSNAQISALGISVCTCPIYELWVKPSSGHPGILLTSATLVRPTLSLDEAVERYELAPPALIKMDVEGAEGALLQGARRALECYRLTIFVALHEEEQKQECQTFLESLR